MNKEVKRGLGVVGALAGARIVATIGNTLLHNHRTEAHRSTKTSNLYRKFAVAEQRTAGIHSHEWAADHRLLHHQFPDADVFNIWKTYRIMQQAEQLGIPLPTEYRGYDRLVEHFTLEEMVKMGETVDSYVISTFGEDHWRPDVTGLTKVEIDEMLGDDKPKYEYSRELFDRKKTYTEEEAIHIMLRDQHSPLLAPTNEDGSWNGVRFVLLNQLKLSRVPTQLLRQRPELFPVDLRPEKPSEVESNHKMVWAGFGIYSIAALALLREFTPKGLVKAATLGSLGNGVGLGFLEKGAAAVNGYGHMGQASNRNIIKATFAKDFEIDINPDGSIATDTIYAGVLGKVISVLTGDEAGQQWGHHMHPDAIAYPDSQGKVSWKNAPTGKLFEAITDSPRTNMVQKGRGLPLNKFGRRPDFQNPAVDIIQKARVRTKMEKLQREMEKAV